MNKKPQLVDADVTEKGLVPAVNDLAKPEADTRFAHESAKLLKDIIRQNNWSRKLGGQSEHIQYEGWQTLGKYYGYIVSTGEAEFIELGGVSGFKAKAKVINEITGVEVGGAEAFCMRDEGNWRAKPTFQLASMAQTRAGSKALRQILGFVVALAGYSPTPAEEMDGVYSTPKTVVSKNEVSAFQKGKIQLLLAKKGKTIEELEGFILSAFNKHTKTLDELSFTEAQSVIGKLTTLPDKVQEKDVTDSDLEEIAKIL